MEFTVYFEFYGKKMKTTIDAHDAEDAKYKILGKVKFIKIEPKERDDVDFLKDFLGMK